MTVYHANWRRQVWVSVICWSITILLMSLCRSWTWDFVDLAYLVGFSLSAFGIWAVLHQRNCKVILWSGGLRMTRGAADIVTLAWGEIESAEWNRVNGETLLNLKNGGQQTFVGADFFGSHRQTRKFIETVNGWKRDSESRQE